MPTLETFRASTVSKPASIEDDPRWSAVQRVLASRNFSKSGRLSAFLTYICRCALEGRSEEITEQQIGINVFSRPANYNPGDDNIVRTTARQLRQRLALYYQEEGGGDSVRIEVPKGAYHPIFVMLTHEIKAQVSSAVPVIEGGPTVSSTVMHNPEASSVIGPTRRWSSLTLVVALGFGVCLALVSEHIMHRIRIHQAPIDLLWSTMFVSNRPTVLVSGDAGLNMYDNLARREVKLGDYVSGAYLSTPQAQAPFGYTWASLASRRYVSWVDLTFADHLRQVQSDYGANYYFKFARDVHLEDLRHSNVILVGAPTYNPWIEMFDNRLNFHLTYDGEHNRVSVLNAQPMNGQPAEYLPSEEDSTHRGYTHGFGYIALTTNLEGDGRVLFVEGSTTAGVDASLSFLLNDSKMGPILRQASEHGRLNNFEVLLAANFLKSSSPDAEVLAIRIQPSTEHDRPAR